MVLTPEAVNRGDAVAGCQSGERAMKQILAVETDRVLVAALRLC